MDLLRDRRNLPVIIGGAVALLAGLSIALALVWNHRSETPAPSPASRAGLVIEAGVDNGSELDAAQPLRCFVQGVFIAELTLEECAKRNGVATVALDVGVDSSGQLAAADRAGTVLTPLPPVGLDRTPPAPSSASAVPSGVAAAPTPAGTCWRYADGDWRKLPIDLTLDGCVQALFAGRCERRGAASYGRWMQQTLRLVSGRVEVSGDNHRFRRLVDQSADCAIPPIG